MAPWALFNGYRWSPPMSQHFRFDSSRSLTALEQDSTIIAVIELSQTKWMVAALVQCGAPTLATACGHGDMIIVCEADDFIIDFEHHIPKRRRAAQYG